VKQEGEVLVPTCRPCDQAWTASYGLLYRCLRNMHAGTTFHSRSGSGLLSWSIVRVVDPSPSRTLYCCGKRDVRDTSSGSRRNSVHDDPLSSFFLPFFSLLLCHHHHPSFTSAFHFHLSLLPPFLNMTSPSRSYINHGRGPRRERVMHELHNAEDNVRVPLLQGSEVIAVKAKSICGNFKVCVRPDQGFRSAYRLHSTSDLAFNVAPIFEADMKTTFALLFVNRTLSTMGTFLD